MQNARFDCSEYHFPACTGDHERYMRNHAASRFTCAGCVGLGCASSSRSDCAALTITLRQIGTRRVARNPIGSYRVASTPASFCKCVRYIALRLHIDSRCKHDVLVVRARSSRALRRSRRRHPRELRAGRLRASAVGRGDDQGVEHHERPLHVPP